MERLVYDYLFSEGLFGKGLLKIYDYSEDKFLDTLFSLAKLAGRDREKITYGLKFFGTSELSGGPSPCARMECRLKNNDELNIISALYADEMWIANPFERYLHAIDRITKNIREGLIIDILLLYRMRPLVENGIVKFTSNSIHLCDNCMQKYMQISPEKYQKRIDSIYKEADKIIYKNTDFYVFNNYENTISIRSKLSGITCRNDETVFSIGDDSDLSAAFKRASNTKSGRIYKKEIKDKGHIENLANKIVEDLFLQETLSAVHGTHTISNRRIDSKLLNLFNTDEEDSRASKMFDNLNYTIPLTQNANLESIVNLRINEGESFQRYRNSMDVLIRENNHLPLGEMREYINDVVQTELKGVHETVVKNKKFLKAKLGKSVVLGGAVISFASFAGFIPDAVKHSMSALGVFHSTNEFIETARKMLSKDYGQKEKNFYFLYELNKK